MYNSKIDAEKQISTEENIASMIREHIETSENSRGESDFTISDEDCQQLGRIILKSVLESFRPDLFDQSAINQMNEWRRIT